MLVPHDDLRFRGCGWTGAEAEDSRLSRQCPRRSLSNGCHNPVSDAVEPCDGTVTLGSLIEPRPHNCKDLSDVSSAPFGEGAVQDGRPESPGDHSVPAKSGQPQMPGPGSRCQRHVGPCRMRRSFCARTQPGTLVVPVARQRGVRGFDPTRWDQRSWSRFATCQTIWGTGQKGLDCERRPLQPPWWRV